MAAGPLLTLKALTTAPLVLTVQISGQTWIQVSVTGTARNVAAVSILNPTLPIYSCTLTQWLPTHKTTADVVASDVTYQAPTTFSLTIPTAEQQGNVFVQSVLVAPGQDPQPLSAPVVWWPLDSGAGAIAKDDGALVGHKT
jgi:hypothetical protein